MHGDLCRSKQLLPAVILFCSRTVSLPMTTTDVIATLASPLNAFKIIIPRVDRSLQRIGLRNPRVFG